MAASEYKLSSIIKAAKARGATFEQGSGTSHNKIRLESGRAYIIPAGNGRRSKVKLCYVTGLCRFADWDRAEFIEDL